MMNCFKDDAKNTSRPEHDVLVIIGGKINSLEGCCGITDEKLIFRRIRGRS